MLKRIRKFLTGHRTAVIPQEEACEAFDLIYRSGIPFSEERRTTDGSIRITLAESGYAHFSRLARSRDMHVTFSPPHGLPVVLDYIKHRPAIPIMLTLALLCLFCSERIVWDIRISGNDKTPDSEIIAVLDSLGFGIGTYYPSVNFNRLHADFLTAQDDISWLSVYMDGTVADIEVREQWKDERDKHSDGVYANIVATEAGVVRSVNVFEGEAAVKPGETVVPGQVLISGVVNMKEDGQVRYEYAAGEVIASVCAPIGISSPLKRTEKVFTGREKAEKTLIFFKKSVNLFINGGKDIPGCDKIETVDRVTLGGRLSLPVWIRTVTYREYAEKEVSVSPAEVADEVLSALSAKLKALAARGTMTKKQLDFRLADGVYSASGAVYLDCDIGKADEFIAAP